MPAETIFTQRIVYQAVQKASDPTKVGITLENGQKFPQNLCTCTRGKETK